MTLPRGPAFVLLLCAAIAAPAVAEIRGAEVVSDSGSIDSTSPKSWSVDCPDGTFALGGGATIASSRTGVSLVASLPVVEIGTGDPIGWFAEATEIVSVASSWGVVAHSVCGRVDGLERVVATSASGSSQLRSAQASCPAGKEALSGGFELLGSTTGVAVFASAPVRDPDSGAPTGWRAAAYEEFATASSWSIRAEVVCANETIFPFRVARSLDADQFKLADLTCPRGWVATGGGTDIFGTVVDWIDGSAPGSFVDTWSVLLQRAEGQTDETGNIYHVLCPEPGALASGALALAALVLHRRRA